MGKERFVEMSEKAADLYRSVGRRKAERLSAEETAISPGYSLVKAHWGARFERAGDKPGGISMSPVSSSGRAGSPRW